MTSTSYIDGVTDAIKTLLNANTATLGSFTTILERDEDPSVIGTRQDLPVLVVIPLGDKPDRVTLTMGSGGEMYHNFSVLITGYYHYDSLTTEIRTMRGYAFSCIDLFRGSAAKVGYGHIYSGSVNPGYYVMVDNPVYRWEVILNIKMLEP
jgi:hypothetical protein